MKTTDTRKTREALLRGYVLFRVNDRYFFRYATAKAARDAVPQDRDVLFEGLHILKGWRCFYLRMHPPFHHRLAVIEAEI